MKDRITRVEWGDVRADGLFLMIAEWDGKTWRFWERESWEVSWAEIAATPTLMAKAEELAEDSNVEYKAEPRSIILKRQSVQCLARTFRAQMSAPGTLRFTEIATVPTNRCQGQVFRQPRKWLIVCVQCADGTRIVTESFESTGGQCAD